MQARILATLLSTCTCFLGQYQGSNTYHLHFNLDCQILSSYSIPPPRLMLLDPSFYSLINFLALAITDYLSPGQQQSVGCSGFTNTCSSNMNVTSKSSVWKQVRVLHTHIYSIPETLKVSSINSLYFVTSFQLVSSLYSNSYFWSRK